MVDAATSTTLAKPKAALRSVAGAKGRIVLSGAVPCAGKGINARSKPAQASDAGGARAPDHILREGFVLKAQPTGVVRAVGRLSCGKPKAQARSRGDSKK
jgi:hypothetical protein